MLCRSLFFLNRKVAVSRKLLGCTPDVIVLDMEDSVSMGEKAAARADLSSFIVDWSRSTPLYVRLNSWECEEELHKDVDELMHKNISGFLIPKVNDACDIKNIDQLLLQEEKRRSLPVGMFKLMPIIETPTGYFNALDIAKSSKRNVALIPGVYDLAAECNAGDSSATIKHIIGQILLAAKAVGISALSSMGICDLDEPSDFERRCIEARNQGFDGSATLTPTQCVIAKRVFTQSKTAVKMAIDIVNKRETGNIRVFQKSINETRFILSPPVVKTAMNLLKKNKEEIAFDDPFSLENKIEVPQNRCIRTEWISTNNVLTKKTAGDVLRTPFEITVSHSMATAWNSSFYNSSPTSTSDVFARKHGLRDAHLPFSMLPFMTLAMSVTSFSVHARYHLALFNAHQFEPVCAGDTVCSTVRLDDVTPAGKSGDFDIVTSTHSLKDTEDHTLYSVQKRTMFAKGLFKRSQELQNVIVPEETVRVDRPDMVAVAEGSAGLDIENMVVADIEEPFDFNKVNMTYSEDHTQLIPPWLWYNSDVAGCNTLTIQVGKLYIHPLVKVFGHSETRSLSHLFWVTNPHQFNICKLAPKDIVVPGPIVTAAATANAGLDLGHVVYEDVAETVNLNKMNMGDMISSISFVSSSAPIQGREGWHVITTRTLGLINLDPDDLIDVEVPCALLQNRIADMRSRDVEKILRESCPVLYHKIACIVNRKLITIDMKT